MSPLFSLSLQSCNGQLFFSSFPEYLGCFGPHLSLSLHGLPMGPKKVTTDLQCNIRNGILRLCKVSIYCKPAPNLSSCQDFFLRERVRNQMKKEGKEEHWIYYKIYDFESWLQNQTAKRSLQTQLQKYIPCIKKFIFVLPSPAKKWFSFSAHTL